MTRAETIEKLKKQRTTLQLRISQLSDHLGPYPHGPGRDQLIDWCMSVEEISKDIATLESEPPGLSTFISVG